MEIPILYDWMIVFFVHEISEDLPESKDMYMAIEEAGAGRNLVFLIKDAIGIDDATNLFSFSMSLSRLVRQADTGKWKFEPEKAFRFDNSRKNCWEQAFEYIYTKFYSRRKVMVTFSHGAVFGINRDGDQLIRPQLPVGPGNGPIRQVRYRRYLINQNDMSQLKKRGWNETNHTIYKNKENADLLVVQQRMEDPVCKSLEVLWISDLAAALDKYLGPTQIDVMLMVNCFMQLFDNGYLLSSKVGYLVAPEGEMDAYGYDYRKLLQRLDETPAIPNKRLVRAILKDYEEMYRRDDREGLLRQTAIFGTELKYYALALAGFEQFVGLLRAEMGKSVELLRDIRVDKVQSVSQDADFPLVDVGYWIKVTCARFRHLPNVEEFRRWFARLHKRLIVAGYVGSDLLAQDARSTAKCGYSGVSIYYPQNIQQVEEIQVAWCAYFDSAISSKFNKESKWSRFLNAYFRLTRSGQVAVVAQEGSPVQTEQATVESGNGQAMPVLGGTLSPSPSAVATVSTPLAVSVT